MSAIRRDFPSTYMIKPDIAVLVVDDEKDTRELLVQLLQQDGYQTDGAGSIHEAEEIVNTDSTQHDVALIDLVLPETAESGLLQEGGFEATRKLLSINPDIKIAIFTGKGDQDALEHLEQTANEIGAYRLIIKGDGKGDNTIEMIEGLVDTVRQLNEIKWEIEETLNTRQWARGLLDTLKLNLCIVDKYNKIWYMDGTYQRLKEEISPYPLSKQCWFIFHGCPYQRDWCSYCPSKKLFQGEEEIKPNIILGRRLDGLHYVQVSATPLRNSKGEIIAALEASHDVSDSPVVKSLSTKEKLNIVLQAIYSRGYDSARVYYATPNGDTLTGICEIGTNLDYQFEGLKIDAIDNPYTRRSLILERAPHIFYQGQYGEYPNAELLKKKRIKQWMEFPLSNLDRRLLGLLTVDNRMSGRELTDKDLWFAQMYADEAATILSEEYYANTRLEVDNKLGMVLEQLRKRGYNRIRLYELSRDKKRLMGRREVGGGLRVIFDQYSFFLHQSANTYQTCIVERKPQLFNRESREDPFAYQVGKEYVDEWIEYPLIDKYKGLVGLLCIDNKGDQKAKLTTDDFEIIQPFAEELASILAADTTTRPEPQPLLTGLDTTDTELALTDDIEKALELILQTAVEFISASSGCIIIWEDWQKKNFRFGASVGSLGESIRKLIDFSPSAIIDVFHITDKEITNEIQKDSEFQKFLCQMNNSNAFRQEFAQIESLAILPLAFHGEVQGTLALYSTDNPLLFTDDKVASLEPLCYRAALTINDWRVAHKAEEETKQAWKSVIDDLAHQLQTPLTTLKLSLEQLTAEINEKHIPDLSYAKMAEHEVASIIKMTNEVLDLKILEEGVSILQPENGTIQHIVTEVNDRVQFAAKEKSIEINPCIPQQPVRVHWDITRIISVLYNIVINAIEHSRSQKVDISCQIEDNSVCFKIADQGIGIAREDIPKIFDKFWKKARDSPKGAGVGLAFAKAIVEAHGGKIEVESELRKGSTFSIWLPTNLGGNDNG